MILNVISGYMTTLITDKFKENHIKYAHVPANMTNLFQPLDLTFNRSAKAFMKSKFTKWCCLQITKQVHSGKNYEKIEVKLLLSTLKPFCASWILELHNYFTSTLGKKITANGWNAVGIINAIKKGFFSLKSLDSSSSINPWDQQIEDNIFYHQTTYSNAEFIQVDYDSDDEDEWVNENSFE